MKTLNRVMLIGNLASDVNLMATTKGVSRATFPVATSRNVKDKEGKLTESTDYHKIVFFGNYADLSKQLLKKGSKVYVEGRLVNNSFKIKNGEMKFRTEIFGDDFNVLSKK